MSVWKTLVKYGMDKEESLEIMTEHALDGLLGPRESENLEPNTSIAIVAQRLLLEFKPDITAARTMEEELVASHMRVVYSVPQHGEYMYTGSPTEPILSNAAAILMNRRKTTGDGPFDALEILSKLFNRGMTLQGDRNELIGRLLDILAIDNAIKNSRTSFSSPKTLFHSSPVRVVDYLKHFVSQRFLQQVLCSTPMNTGKIDPTLVGVTLEEMFKDCWVHTSHYVKADDDDVLQVRNIWAYWIRGCAVQLKRGGRSNRMIPIHWTFFPETLDLSMKAWSQAEAGSPGDTQSSG